MSSGFVPVYNRLDTPVVVDFEGHTVAGRSWGVAHTLDDRTKDAVARGELAVLDVGDLETAEAEGAKIDQAAAAAAAVARLVEERHARLAELDKDALVAHYTGETRGGAAVGEGHIDNVADLSVGELRRALAVRTATPLPPAPRRRSTSTEEK